MATFTETKETVFTVIECGGCGVMFAMTEAYNKQRREDHKGWCCPNGCNRIYEGKTEAQKLREQLATAEQNAKYHAEQARRERQEAEHFKKSRDAYKGRVTHLKNRAAEGMCPCCNEKFPNLHEHMKSNHPEFLEQEEPVIEISITEPVEAPKTFQGMPCGKCGRVFTFKKSFKKHIAICKGRKKAERAG